MELNDCSSFMPVMVYMQCWADTFPEYLVQEFVTETGKYNGKVDLDTVSYPTLDQNKINQC